MKKLPQVAHVSYLRLLEEVMILCVCILYRRNINASLRSNIDFVK